MEEEEMEIWKLSEFSNNFVDEYNRLKDKKYFNNDWNIQETLENLNLKQEFCVGKMIFENEEKANDKRRAQNVLCFFAGAALTLLSVAGYYQLSHPAKKLQAQTKTVIKPA